MAKNLPVNAGYVGSIPGTGRSPGGGNGNLLQYSCLGNPMHRGVWYVIVLMVAHDLIGNDLGTKQQQIKLPPESFIFKYHYTLMYKFGGTQTFSP